MTTHKHPIGEQTHKTIVEIEALAGTIRLEIHLATMELKDRWKELEPRVAAAKKASEDALEELATSLRSLKDALSSKHKS